MFKKLLLLAFIPWGQVAAQCYPLTMRLLQKNEQQLRNEFSLAVSQHYPSVFEKVDQLEKIDLQGIDMDEILGATYIRDREKRYKALEKLGLNPSKIALLQQMGVFDLSPYRYRWLTGLFPMKTIQIRPGVRVSIPNREGYLVSAVIDHTEGNRAYLTLDFSQLQEIRPFADIYHPIIPHKLVLYTEEENAIPHIAKIQDVASDGTVSLNVFPKEKRLPMEKLQLIGLEQTKTGGQDFSRKLSRGDIKKLWSAFKGIKDLYDGHDFHGFIKANNRFMATVNALLQEQGIFSSIYWNHNGIWNLHIDGVHQNGNRVARKYQRMLEEQGYLRATFSIVDPMSIRARAFYRPSRTRVEFGVASILKLLEGRFHSNAFHEIRHLMRDQKNKTNRRTIFNYEFISYLELRGRDFYGRSNFLRGEKMPFQNYFSYDELYTISSDIVYLAKKLRLVRKGKIEGDEKKLLNSIYFNVSKLYATNRNVTNLVNAVLKRPLKIVFAKIDGLNYLLILAPGFRSILLPLFGRTNDVYLQNISSATKQEIKEDLIHLSVFSQSIDENIEQLLEKTVAYGRGQEVHLLQEARKLLLAVRAEDRKGKIIFNMASSIESEILKGPE